MPTDRFRQELNVEFDPPADSWRIAMDSLSIIEAVYGDVWSKVRLDLSATSTTMVTFRARDIVSLRSNFESHGGKVQYVSINAHYWDGWPGLDILALAMERDEGGLWMLSFTLAGPMRVEVEAAAYSIQRSINILGKKKRWSEAKVVLAPMQVWSDATRSREVLREPVIKPRGLRVSFYRWFVLHRNEIILTLGGGFAVSILVIVLQLIGILPIP